MALTRTGVRRNDDDLTLGSVPLKSGFSDEVLLVACQTGEPDKNWEPFFASSRWNIGCKLHGTFENLTVD